MTTANIVPPGIEFSEYVGYGTELVRFKLVRYATDIHDPKMIFKPVMCHQVFGPSEQIFGFRKLRIEVLYEALTFQCYLRIIFAGRIQDELQEMSDYVQSEDFLARLTVWLPKDFFTHKIPFLKVLFERNKPDPFGHEIDTFVKDSDTRKDVHYAVHFCTGQEPGYKEFHDRMQTIIVWFIDAASKINLDDTKWNSMILYEIEDRRTQNVYYPVGYCTLYLFYKYPSSLRHRISQFIVFPPFQNRGLGSQFLKAIYKYMCKNPKIYDFGVEDPSDQFQMLRDTLDAKNCLTLKAFSATRCARGYSAEMIYFARKCFKINEKQCRRIYEIIHLYYTDEEGYEAYLQAIRYRLNSPSKPYTVSRRYRQLRMRKGDTLQAEQRARVIEKHLQNLIAKYRLVVSKLKL